MVKNSVPVWIEEITAPDGKKKLTASIPVNALGMEDLQAKLRSFESRYQDLLKACHQAFCKAKVGQGGKSIRLKSYWEIGDRIINFQNEMAQEELFLASIINHLARDLRQPVTQLNYCVQFRRLYRSWHEITPEVSWSNYVELFPLPQQLRKDLERKMATGEIRSRDALREIIKRTKTPMKKNKP